MKISFVHNGPASQRLDTLVSAHLAEHPRLAGFSRSQVKRWVDERLVSANGEAAVKCGLEVCPDARVDIDIPDDWYSSPLESETRVLSIVFEDRHLLVLDKPAGLSVHPGAGQRRGTLVNALIGHFGAAPGGLPQGWRQPAEFGERPGIVHRLDKDTTGLLVVAKTVPAHRGLSDQFAAHTIERAYQALVLCTPRARRAVNLQEQGSIEAPLARHHQRRERFTVSDQGRTAVTHWRVLRRMGYGCLLEVRLETGRTHQIRVHMNHIGRPVIGDRVYGDFSALPAPLRRLHERFGRQALHAYRLGFIHPHTKQRLEFESPLPHDMQELADKFGAYGA